MSIQYSYVLYTFAPKQYSQFCIKGFRGITFVLPILRAGRATIILVGTSDNAVRLL